MSDEHIKTALIDLFNQIEERDTQKKIDETNATIQQKTLDEAMRDLIKLRIENDGLTILEEIEIQREKISKKWNSNDK